MQIYLKNGIQHCFDFVSHSNIILNLMFRILTLDYIKNTNKWNTAILLNINHLYVKFSCVIFSQLLLI